MRKLICAFVVRIWHKTHFFRARLIINWWNTGKYWWNIINFYSHSCIFSGLRLHVLFHIPIFLLICILSWKEKSNFCHEYDFNFISWHEKLIFHSWLRQSWNIYFFTSLDKRHMMTKKLNYLLFIDVSSTLIKACGRNVNKTVPCLRILIC